MNINAVITLEVDDDVAIIAANSPPVNALSANVRQGIEKAMGHAIEDTNVQGVVILCEGRTFFAGADITEFGKPMTYPTLEQLLDKIENAPKPVVAAIHGTALGGGLETALVAHYRIATRSAKCGLPEINLGLMAGGGGVVRLPRLVGVAKALDMILSGRPISAPEALDCGVVDALADDGDLRAAAVRFVRQAVAEKRPLRRVRDIHENISKDRDLETIARFRTDNARRYRDMLAAEYNLKGVEAAISLPFDEAFRTVRRMFDDLVAGPQSAAQRHAFFAERQAGKVAGVSSTQPRPIARIGVVGVGTMGGGITTALLNAGLPVALVEAEQKALDRGVSAIRKQYEAGAAKGRLSAAQVEERMAAVSGSLELDSLRDCDLIIEAVFERLDVKQALMAKIDAIAKPDAILATNTSYLDVDAIAAATGRPQSVVGLHFFSPANVMRLLEVVRGEKTAPDIIDTALAFAKRIGKVGVVVGNCYGFVGNRILAQRQREADKLILEGALPWDIDRVHFDFGLPMGPFQMRDLAGLDLGWDAATSKSESVSDILCEMGRRGQKTGAGFYDYDASRAGTPSPAVEKVIQDFAARRGVKSRSISDREILERCLYPMVNEGAKILDEGIAQRASDIDVVWLLGYGWPIYRGGPMYWAEQEGLPKILERMQSLVREHGEDFRPAPLLERLAAEGKGFSAFEPGGR